MSRRTRRNAWLTTLGAVIAIALVAIGIGVSGSLAAAGSSGSGGPDDVIVRVTGDAANGFEIYYADGTERFPPTDSEAIAECTEYDTRVQRVRCKVEVRTWYRDLRDIKRTIRYLHNHADG